jgi:hypothetical protein
LSFAGEQRAYVREVASELAKRNVTTFFDEDEEVSLWGKNLIEEFQRIYMTASHVVVMFVSKEYAEKPWTRHERRSALARALQERREYVLPVRFDDTVLEGLDPNLAYLSLRDRSPQQLAEAILQKLVHLGGRVELAKPSFRPHDIPVEPEAVCRVTVKDENGEPIQGANVVLIAQNGTSSQGSTGADGVAEVPAQVRRSVAVFVAHPQHPAAHLQHHDSGTALDVTLPVRTGGHSVIFTDQTGTIPGFRPRLNPIGGGHNAEALPSATYMYVTNGSVDGQSQQPFFFRVGKPMILEDNEGHQVRATCVGFVGQSTLWEYEYPEGPHS